MGGERSCTKHGAGLVPSMLCCRVKYRRLRVEGAADAEWTAVVYKAWSTVSYLHASF